MVICAAKVRWRELSAAATLLAAFVLCLWGGRSQSAAVAGLSSSPAPQDPAAYLASLGWETVGDPVCDQVQMPDTFGPAYDQFLQLQREGGFHLETCAGAVVTRYTFTLSNYPSGEAGILADVMMLEGRIVGGEIRSPALDGFMEPLTARPEQK